MFNSHKILTYCLVVLGFFSLCPSSAMAGGEPKITVKKMPCACRTYGETELRSNTEVHWEATCPMNVKMHFFDDDASLVGYLRDGRTVVYGVCDQSKYDWLKNDFGITGCSRPGHNGAAICSRNNKLVKNIPGINHQCPTDAIKNYEVMVLTGDRLELDISAGGSGTFMACPKVTHIDPKPECDNNIDDDGDGVSDFIDESYQFNSNGDIETPRVHRWNAFPGSQIPHWDSDGSMEIQNIRQLYGAHETQVFEMDNVGTRYSTSFTIPADYISKTKQAVLRFDYSPRNSVARHCNGVQQRVGYYVQSPGSSELLKLGTVSAFPSRNTKRPVFQHVTTSFPTQRSGSYSIVFIPESSCHPGYGMLVDNLRVNGSDDQCDNPSDPTENGTTHKPECSDGIDNDGDYLTDYPADPGCDSPEDNDEEDPVDEGQHACNDGIDNDWDGRVDKQDPHCRKRGATDEYRKNQIFAETECVTLVKDPLGVVTDVIAHLTPFNRYPGTVGVSVGSTGVRSNYYLLDGENYTPTESAHWYYRRFPKGRRQGRLSVLFPGDSELEWVLGTGRERSAAIVNADTIECRDITPSVCRFSDSSGNEKLRWSYTNSTHFKPLLLRGEKFGVNYFEPSRPSGKLQPQLFQKLENKKVFDTYYIDGLTWHLAGKKATADSSTPYCSN